jgi:hypothetical protein
MVSNRKGEKNIGSFNRYSRREDLKKKKMVPSRKGEENIDSFNRYSRREDC